MKSYINIVKCISVVCIMLVSVGAWAQRTYKAINNGDWSNSSTWQYGHYIVHSEWYSEWVSEGTGVPGKDDDVVLDNYEVNVDRDGAAKSVLVNGNGFLNFKSGNVTLTVGSLRDEKWGEAIRFSSNNNTLIVEGDVYAVGDFNNQSGTGNVMRIAGNFTGSDQFKTKGAMKTVFDGERLQYISTANNTGTCTFSNLELDNASGLSLKNLPWGVTFTVTNDLTLTQGVLKVANTELEEAFSSQRKISVGGKVYAQNGSWIWGVLTRTSSDSEQLFPVGTETEQAWMVVYNVDKPWSVRYYNFKSDDVSKGHAQVYTSLEARYWSAESDQNGGYNVGLQYEGYESVDKIVSLFSYRSNGNQWIPSDNLEIDINYPVEIVKTKEAIKNKAGKFTFGLKQGELGSVEDVEVDEYIWTGKVDNDWFKAGNWLNNKVPDATSDVYILNRYTWGSVTIDGQTYEVQGGVTYNYGELYNDTYGNCGFPVIYGEAYAHNVVLSSSATMVVGGNNNGGGAILHVKGNFTSDDNIYGLGTLCFDGSDKQVIASTIGTGANSFEMIVKCNTKVSNAMGVDLAENMSLNVTRSFNLDNGVVKIVGDKDYIRVASLSGSNFGPTKHFDGMLYRDFQGEAMFPIGNGGRYCPVKLSAGNSPVGAKFLDMGPQKDNGPSEMYYLLDKGYWVVDHLVTWSNVIDLYSITFTYDSESVLDKNDGAYISYLSDVNSTWQSKSPSKNKSQKTVTLSGNAKVYKGGSYFACGPTDKEFQWTGAKNTDWFNKENWNHNKIPVRNKYAYIEDTYNGSPVTRFPVIENSSEVAAAYLLRLIGVNACLTVQNGGRLDVTESISVSQDNVVNALVIKNRYDNMCQVRLGGNVEIEGMDAEYSNVLIENTLPTGRYSYIGSATKEGSLTDWVSSDILKLYDAFSDDYIANAAFASDYQSAGIVARRGSLGDAWTMKQTGTIKASGKVSLNVPQAQWEDGIYTWSLVANPYTFSIPLGNADVLSYKNIDPVIWFRAFDNATSKFFFTTYSLATRIGVPSSNSVAETVSYMAPQQAFFVRPRNANAASVVFNPSKYESQLQPTSKLKDVAVVSDVLRLSLSSSEEANVDEVAYVFRNGGSMFELGDDAVKMSLSESQNQIYSVKGSGKYAIPSYPSSQAVGEELMMLGVVLSAGCDEGTLAAVNLDEFEGDVYLQDLLKGVEVNLREISEYQFEAEEGAVIEDRFAISLKSLKASELGDTPTSIERVSLSQIVFSRVSNDELTVVLGNYDDSVSCVNVYDITGQLINKVDVHSNKINVSLDGLHGIYVVEVINGIEKNSCKLHVM